MTLASLRAVTRYWLPPPVDRRRVAPRLARFYSERADYHEMTACESKVDHPQVRLLLNRIRPEDIVVEFGCGGGVVLSAAGHLARSAIGFDIGDIALAKARSRHGAHQAVKADVARVPLPSNAVDIAYSFEVLEHVWDPAAVIREMVRVVKPGGTVLFTTPNGYSMDLHLRHRRAVRAAHIAGALASSARAILSMRPYENIPPDLDTAVVYPDCDMITRLHPTMLMRFARRAGCRVDRLETFFFMHEKASSDDERRRYAMLNHHPFYRWFGDHILFVGTKAR